MPARSLFDDVRALVGEVISRSDPVRRVEALQIRDDGAVLMATTAAGVRLVVKVAAARTDYPISFERTAVLTALARSTGRPEPLGPEWPEPRPASRASATSWARSTAPSLSKMPDTLF